MVGQNLQYIVNRVNYREPHFFKCVTYEISYTCNKKSHEQDQDENFYGYDGFMEHSDPKQVER